MEGVGWWGGDGGDRLPESRDGGVVWILQVDGH